MGAGWRRVGGRKVPRKKRNVCVRAKRKGGKYFKFRRKYRQERERGEREKPFDNRALLDGSKKKHQKKQKQKHFLPPWRLPRSHSLTYTFSYAAPWTFSSSPGGRGTTLAHATSRCVWPAWKCVASPAGPHIQAHQPALHTQGAPSARLEMLALSLQALTSRHINP